MISKNIRIQILYKLVSAISEKVGQISGHKELESKPHLRRNNRIKSIHSSLKIEANSLSLSEVCVHTSVLRWEWKNGKALAYDTFV